MGDEPAAPPSVPAPDVAGTRKPTSEAAARAVAFRPPAPGAADMAVPVPRPAAPPHHVPAPAPRGTRPAADLATGIGPGILVAVGALAVVVALGLFVKYAWDNNWIGPGGRVLISSVASLAMLAAGVRLMRGVYRPLGQGLAGAGLAGMYATAYGAHAFYGLISREAAAALLV